MTTATTRRTPRTSKTTGLSPLLLAQARAMPEEKGRHSLLANVLDECKTLDLYVAHFRHAMVGGRVMTPVQADGTGFPDLMICGNRIIYRENKSWTGTLSAEQEEWGRRILSAGGDWAVWTPEHWFNGRIHAELGALYRKSQP
jgi:hypothetical protein